MVKSLLFIAVLAAVACSFAAAATLENAKETKIPPKLAEIEAAFKKFVALWGTSTVGNIFSGVIHAGYGEKCTYDTDFLFKSQCAPLETHLVCYTNARCSCIDVAQFYKESAERLPEAQKQAMLKELQLIQNAGFAFEAMLEFGKCKLSEDSPCLDGNVDLTPLLEPLVPPGYQLDRQKVAALNRAVNTLKCGSQLTCKRNPGMPDNVPLGSCEVKGDGDDDDDDDDDDGDDDGGDFKPTDGSGSIPTATVSIVTIVYLVSRFGLF